MKSCGRYIPIPPVILFVLAGLMWLISLGHIWMFSFSGQLFVALGIGLFGLFVVILSKRLFHKAKTTWTPFRPETSTTLVVCGLYRFSRNPMYVGLLLILIAWGVFLGDFLALLLIPLFIIPMNRFQIIPEEHALESLFGDEYKNYKSRVRRWI